MKSANVDAPGIEEFPLTLECELVEAGDTPSGYRVLGKIVNVLADEAVLDAEGNIDSTKIKALVFDQISTSYFALGEKLETAMGPGQKYV